MPSKMSADVAAENGRDPGRHLVEHDAEREQIGARVELFAARLFRRHVRDRAHGAARARQVVFRRGAIASAWRWRPPIRRRCRFAGVRFARPKSRIFAGPRSTRKMFAGLMSRCTIPFECARRGRRRSECRSPGAPNLDRLGGDAVLERLALEQLHGDERPALEFSDVVNRADVRMIERRRGARLAAKPLDRLRVLGDVVGKELQRHVPAEAGVLAL